MSDETVVERPKNLREKLVAVMADVRGVGKHGRNKDQNYDYQSAADIFDKVQIAFAKHGIAFVSTEKEAKQLDSHQTKGGATMFAWKATMIFELINADGVIDLNSLSAAERIGAVHSGIGFDTSDKALNKAKTAALKYFLKQTLLIGEDEDDGDRENITPEFEKAAREYHHRDGSRSAVPSPAEPAGDDFLGDPSPTPTPARKTHLKPLEAFGLKEDGGVAHGDEPISVVAQESIKVQCRELGVTVQEICEQCGVTELDQITQNQYAAIQRIFDRKRENRKKVKE